MLDLDSLEGFEVGCCWCIFWKSLNCCQAPKAHLAAARALIQCPQQVLEKQEVSGEGELGWLGPLEVRRMQLLKSQHLGFPGCFR